MSHKAVLHLIEQHYFIRNVHCIEQLSQKDQRQLALAVIQDFEYFDPADMMLYDPIKNIVHFLIDYYEERIEAVICLDKLFMLIIEQCKSDINELFDEIIENEKMKEIGKSSIDNVDFIRGFI